jgi:hypothetical protein
MSDIKNKYGTTSTLTWTLASLANNAASAGTMLQRKVEARGTNTSAQSWQFTAEITVTAA